MRINAMSRVVRTLLLLLSAPVIVGLAVGTMGMLPLGAASAPLTAVRFAIIGDYGWAGQPELDVSNLVHGWNPDFIITTGDNNYDLGGASTIDPNIGAVLPRLHLPVHRQLRPRRALQQVLPLSRQP